jgi:phosphoribosylanthranilate isomerase
VPELSRIPRVKVCGLTSAADALQALDVGAQALGFVFHPSSPRCADPGQVAALVTHLPQGILSVAVTVNATPDEARELLDTTGLSAVQLCGDQVAPDWKEFRAPILRRVGVDESAPEEIKRWRGIASVFLLDHPSSPGGSGKDVDLALASQLCADYPCLLAGGLDADCVSGAIRRVRPRGVDASSRLEVTPGHKDHMAVKAFVSTALGTFAELQT